MDLFDKLRHSLQKLFLIMVDKDVEIDSVLATSEKCLAIIPSIVSRLINPVRPKIIENIEASLVEILRNHLHYQRPRINRLQISSRHLKHQTHGTRHSYHDLRPSLHLPRLGPSSSLFKA